MKSVVCVKVTADFSMFTKVPSDARRQSSNEVSAMTFGHVLPFRSQSSRYRKMLESPYLSCAAVMENTFVKTLDAAARPNQSSLY